ncbi:hypothetical protein GV794_07070 [Nocardia cyriacigeorgica]|uniref:Uncharacterized protein n=1 Tax=Nocardia cyriacigeorgica TaxID=135487 RepID=A0ABX0CHQ3_9NOCA|nr:hypothetical protein [Nocardia cyriacigeorgica]
MLTLLVVLSSNVTYTKVENDRRTSWTQEPAPTVGSLMSAPSPGTSSAIAAPAGQQLCAADPDGYRDAARVGSSLTLDSSIALAQGCNITGDARHIASTKIRAA